MQKLLHLLEIPPEYSRYETLAQESTDLAQNLDNWKDKSASRLSDLALHLSAVPEPSLEEQILLVVQVSQYDGDGPWVSKLARLEAKKILLTFVTPTIPLLQNILATQIRPIFQSNVHPNLNPDTGRRLTRAAGGPLASQDLYTSQSWKDDCPGVANVLLWVVKKLKDEDYEKLWHLVIPPVMTLLDDYDAGYKLQGIQVVAEMLKHVPADLLKRTGVDGLLFSSLKTTLSFLNNSRTPAIICTAVPTLVSLINVVTPIAYSTSKVDQGKERFDRLSSILGDGIIGTIWMYGSRDVPTIQASITVLPLVVEALGIGSVRYLKAMVHQLVHPLLPSPPAVDLPSSSQPNEGLKLASLRGLTTIIRVCGPRIVFWKGTILDAAARCWVYEVENKGSDEIKAGVREVVAELRRSCPSIADDEFRRLLDTDTIFVELLKSHDAT